MPSIYTNVLREYIHVDYHKKRLLDNVFYFEPLENEPNLDRLGGYIFLNEKKIWFCMGLWPNAEEPYCYQLTLDWDQGPIVLGEYDPKNNRFVISLNEHVEETYIEVYYDLVDFDWKEWGF